jgi:drug/metabolite transporter (DMT)-like permease
LPARDKIDILRSSGAFPTSRGLCGAAPIRPIFSDMLSLTGGFVLLAAVLHASWNALLHGNRDRFLSMAWMSIAIAVASTYVVMSHPLPAVASWPYIVASGLVHIVYNISLVRSYRRNDLALAYPIARGSSPLLVALGAAVFAHEAIGPVSALGIALTSAGIIAIALQRHRVSRAGVLAALATGATIALYTVIDGIGVRLSDGQPLVYTAWMFMFYWLMPLLFVATRGIAPLWTPLRDEPLAVASSLAGGLVSLAAYGIVIWALQSDAMGMVSALRETSVVFAVLIGRVFLRETVTATRWLACLVVAAGAVCLGL